MFSIMSGGDDPTGEAVSEPTFIGMNSQIVSDLITKAGLIPNVVATPNNVLEEFKCIQAVIYERILALQKAVDYQLRYDPVTRKVHYEPRGHVDNNRTLTTGQEIIGIPEWVETTDGMINDLRIDGATVETQITESGQIGVTEGFTPEAIQLTKTPNIVEVYMDSNPNPVTQRVGGSKDASVDNFYWIDREMQRIMPKKDTTFTPNHYAKINYSWSAPAPVQDFRQDSIDQYGRFQETFTFNDISSVADAETRMEKILDNRSKPFLTGKLLLKEDETIKTGEIVRIIDNLSEQKVNERFVITKIKRTYPSGIMEIEVGDKEWKLEDDIIELENRVKRLEEQFIRNQDILLQLLRLEDTFKTPKERYLKLLEKNIGGDIGIWGNAQFGVWGECKWGNENEQSFILGKGLLGFNALGSKMSEEKLKYFSSYGDYYEDFRDTEFKDDTESTTWDNQTYPHEVMVSKPVTFNEKVIKSCSLYGTSPIYGDYYLDNGNGWEQWTSNPHTFASDGNMIRWKYVETDLPGYHDYLRITY